MLSLPTKSLGCTGLLVFSSSIALSQAGGRNAPIPPIASIATLQAQDKISASRSEVTPQFSIQSISNDGNHLFVSINEVGDFQDSSKAVRFAHWSVQDVVLKAGSTTQPLVKIRDDFQWFFGETGLLASANVSKPSEPIDTPQRTSSLTVGTATDEPPPNDVLSKFTPHGLVGKAIYTPTILVSGKGNTSQWHTFLVLRRAGKGENTVQTFPVQTQATVFGPRWSPNGQIVLLKVGVVGDRYDTYSIHFWNPSTGQIWRGPNEQITYLRPQWSPDSQKVAYVVGGDISGFNDWPEPLSLHVYDIKTRQSRKLASAIPTFGTVARFAWAGSTTLLYTQPPLSPDGNDRTENTKTSFRPHIYQVPANGGEPKPLLQDAFAPCPSPDGKRIAFFGWPKDTTKQTTQKTTVPQALSGARLFVWEKVTGQRLAVQPPIKPEGTQLVWTPDGKKLILLQATYNAKTARGTAKISTLSLKQ